MAALGLHKHLNLYANILILGSNQNFVSNAQ